MSGSKVCASFMLIEPVAGNRQLLVPVKAAVPVTARFGIRPGDVSLGEVEDPVMQRCAHRARSLERDALQGDGELVDLRVPAELLRLPQRAGQVDRAPNRRIAGDTLHMKGAQKGSDVEVGQHMLAWVSKLPCRAVWPLTWSCAAPGCSAQ
jgi:hypothetical protein